VSPSPIAGWSQPTRPASPSSEGTGVAAQAVRLPASGSDVGTPGHQAQRQEALSEHAADHLRPGPHPLRTRTMGFARRRWQSGVWAPAGGSGGSGRRQP
jgi:hypothetical protein